MISNVSVIVELQYVATFLNSKKLYLALFDLKEFVISFLLIECASEVKLEPGLIVKRTVRVTHVVGTY